MWEVFLRLFNVSVAASWLVLAVAVLRPLLRRAPKAVRCLMWALVGARLLLPFSIESEFSAVPSREVITQETVRCSPSPTIHTGVRVFDDAVNPAISARFAPAPGDSVNPLHVLTEIAGWVWLAGLAVMAGYFIISSALLKRRVRDAVRSEDGIYETSAAPSPFVFGFIRPRIYMPAGMEPEARRLVAEHERAHIKRRDYLIKPIAFLILAVYWFNPAIWAAYVLLCRDIELACDERVLRKLGPECKKAYSQALLTAVTFHRSVAACPVAFGEGKLKSRVKNVLSWKKPVIWITLASLAVCAALAVFFLTDPKEEYPEGVEAGYYVRAGDTGDMWILLREDGSASTSVSYAMDWALADAMSWEYEEGTVTVKAAEGRTYCFRAAEEGLVFIAQGSDQFFGTAVDDGALFRYDSRGGEKYGGSGGAGTGDPGTSAPPDENLEVEEIYSQSGKYRLVYVINEVDTPARVEDTVTGELIWDGSGEPGTFLWGGFAGDDRYLAMRRDGQALVVEVVTGKEYKAEPPHGESLTPLCWCGDDWLMLKFNGGLAIYTVGDRFALCGEDMYDALFEKALNSDGAYAESAGRALSAAFDADGEGFLARLSGLDRPEAVAQLLVYEKSYGDLDMFIGEILRYAAFDGPEENMTSPVSLGAGAVYSEIVRLTGSPEGGIQTEAQELVRDD